MSRVAGATPVADAPVKLAGEVAINLGGEVLVARPTYAACVEIRDKTGHALGESLRLISACDIVEMTLVLAPFLRAAGGKLTDARVGELIVCTGVLNAVDEVSRVIQTLFGDRVEPEQAAGERTRTSEKKAGRRKRQRPPEL